jgi:hypothetical protein
MSITALSAPSTPHGKAQMNTVSLVARYVALSCVTVAGAQWLLSVQHIADEGSFADTWYNMIGVQNSSYHTSCGVRFKFSC